MTNEEQEQTPEEIRGEMIKVNRNILQLLNDQYLFHQQGLMLLREKRGEVLQQLRELGDLNVKNE